MKKILLFHFFMLIFLSFQMFASTSQWVFLEFNDIVRAQPVHYVGTAFPSISLWSTACKSQPKNREGADFKKGHSGFKRLGNKNLQWQEFKKVLDAWFAMMVTGPLCDDVLWQNSNHAMEKPGPLFYDVNERPEFTPFAQKIIAKSGDQFFIRGDLHGDIFSLLAQLEKMRDENILDDNFRIIPDNAWVLFLGDYVDRGQYGCEVLYTMMRLSLANPDRVIFVRGNHEDIGISSSYGFKEEIKYKFNDDDDGAKHLIISRMNDLLPVVLYIGCQDTNSVIVDSGTTKLITNYLQCCHGGLEIGYDPKPFLDNHRTYYQLLGLLNQKSFINNFVSFCDQQMSGMQNWLKSWIRTHPSVEKK